MSSTWRANAFRSASLAATIFAVWSCKLPTVAPSSAAGAGNSSPLTAAQEAVLDDLGLMNTSAAYTVGQALTPKADGTFSLTIDGVTLTLDPRPGDGDGDAKFVDVIAALGRAARALKESRYGGAIDPSLKGTAQNLYTLLVAEEAGDLDLKGSRLVRESLPPVALPPGVLSPDNSSGTPPQQPTPNASVDAGEPFTSQLALTATFDRGAYFHNQRRIYLVNAIQGLLQVPSKPSQGGTGQSLALATASSGAVGGNSPASCERRQKLVAPSILSWKRGDLDRVCRAKVDQFSAQGFRRIALFVPIHYAGSVYRESSRSLPVYGSDYRFETLGAVTADEVERCVGYILDKGIELTYLPHVESIVTMNAKGEAEWRIETRVDLGSARYFDRAYAPMVRAINARSGRIPGRPTISLAAEVDGSFYDFPETAFALAQRLTTSLNLPRTAYTLTFNPNGDLFSTHEPSANYAARHIDGCGQLTTLFTSVIDGIAPSVYDSYHHVYPEKGAPSFAVTRSAFLKNLDSAVGSICGALGGKIASRFVTRFSSGEFSLQGPRAGSYKDYLEEALAQEGGEFSRVTLWSSGTSKFDPFADGKTGATITSFLRCP